MRTTLSSICGTLQVPLAVTASNPWPSLIQMLCLFALTLADQKHWTVSSRRGKGRLTSFAPMRRLCLLAIYWLCRQPGHTEGAVQAEIYPCYM